jgi:hypothetical protein
MKKLYFLLTVAVLLLLSTNVMKSQTTQTKLNQTELMKQFLGTWQRNISKDTVEVWECKQYGKSFEMSVYLLIKDKKVPIRLDNLTLSSEIDKFKGFQIYYDGKYSTYIGSFVSDKKINVDFVQDFNKEIVFFKYEFVIETTKNVTMTGFTKDGVKTDESKYVKIK